MLDTADGRLARLQGTSSAFGRWLDNVLDELADVTLHAAIAWSVYQSSHQVTWLAIGMLYLGGKYVFMIHSFTGMEIEADSRAEAHARIGGQAALEFDGRRSRTAWASAFLFPAARVARRFVALAGHADLRWHLWILLAMLGRLDLALVGYALYYPLRTLAGVTRKAVARA